MRYNYVLESLSFCLQKQKFNKTQFCKVNLQIKNFGIMIINGKFIVEHL